jgi:hypothetical protein
MKLEFLIRPIIFKHPGRESFTPGCTAVVNMVMTDYKYNLYVSGATIGNRKLNTANGWQFYNLRKL